MSNDIVRDSFEEFVFSFLGSNTAEKVADSYWHTFPGELWRQCWAKAEAYGRKEEVDNLMPEGEWKE